MDGSWMRGGMVPIYIKNFGFFYYFFAIFKATNGKKNDKNFENSKGYGLNGPCHGMPGTTHCANLARNGYFASGRAWHGPTHRPERCLALPAYPLPSPLPQSLALSARPER